MAAASRSWRGRRTLGPGCAVLAWGLSCASAPEPPPRTEQNDDPCAGVALPPCPPDCTAPPTVLQGQVCENDGAACGNDVGDGCTCAAGQWDCTVKLRAEGGCPLICDREL